jgi:hypothetical protein
MVRIILGSAFILVIPAGLANGLFRQLHNERVEWSLMFFSIVLCGSIGLTLLWWGRLGRRCGRLRRDILTIAHENGTIDPAVLSQRHRVHVSVAVRMLRQLKERRTIPDNIQIASTCSLVGITPSRVICPQCRGEFDLVSKRRDGLNFEVYDCPTCNHPFVTPLATFMRRTFWVPLLLFGVSFAWLMITEGPRRLFEKNVLEELLPSSGVIAIVLLISGMSCLYTMNALLIDQRVRRGIGRNLPSTGYSAVLYLLMAAVYLFFAVRLFLLFTRG